VSTTITAPVDTSPTGAIEVSLKINGRYCAVTIDPRVTLLDLLRDRLHLTGTKKGCAVGHCGACTVLMHGKPVNACLLLAVMAHGADITTIEGLATGGALHPLQRAFVEHDALQCGYCTPGQIMAAMGLLERGASPSDADIRTYMSGNICRCGAYTNIVAAIRQTLDGLTP
jgi:xanthine dehydrogenase YagT iron-sulfur-binding subunit